ncbi:VOC family protein [Sinorhizobium meliloti]|nr:VOC family protein [Sinorhizobium meliloti]
MVYRGNISIAGCYLQKLKNPPPYVEHVQIVVSNLATAEAFYSKVFGWSVRGRGRECAADRTYDWIHIGTDTSYMAFRTPYNGAAFNDSHRGHSGNHVGIVVGNLAGIMRALDELGVQIRCAKPHPHRARLYFRDFDGNEIEVVEYFSEAPEDRNDYTL